MADTHPGHIAVGIVVVVLGVDGSEVVHDAGVGFEVVHAGDVGSEVAHAAAVDSAAREDIQGLLAKVEVDD